MTRALAAGTAAAALLALGAGCGGNGSAVGTTVTSDQGVLGAQATRTQSRAQVQSARIGWTLDRASRRLEHARDGRDAAQVAQATSAALLRQADRLEQTNVPPRALQQKRDLVSALRSLATDVQSDGLDAKSNGIDGLVGAMHNLGSLAAARDALANFRSALKR